MTQNKCDAIQYGKCNGAEAGISDYSIADLKITIYIALVWERPGFFLQ